MASPGWARKLPQRLYAPDADRAEAIDLSYEEPEGVRHLAARLKQIRQRVDARWL